MKYIIEFSKTGTICYTSHLDLLKVFKRAFKKAGIRIAYSQGFNPHPKMGFGQPLSLGYWGLEEYVEFETVAADPSEEEMTPQDMLSALSAIMPEGLELKRILEAPWLRKTLAAENIAAEHMIEIPALFGDADDIRARFLGQEQILVLKKQKKKQEPVQIDIKSKIRELRFHVAEGTTYIDAVLDSGSESNLSPELLINALTECFDLHVPRSEMNVARKRLIFKEQVQEALSKS
ncbi:MAG: DUF2344 domain-containing protein [Firmicutes bacterium]|nr:DUF2344 domain-containing protein [Bacillota bacterium]